MGNRFSFIRRTATGAALGVAFGLWALIAHAAEFAEVQGLVNANVRSGNSEHARIVRSVAPGTHLEVLAKDTTFTQVKLPDGAEGWVLNRLLRYNVKGDAPPASAPQAAEVTAEAPASGLPVPRAERVASAPAPVAAPATWQDRLALLAPFLTDWRWWGATGGAFVLGLLLGIIGLDRHYRKRLHGLRI